MRNQQPGLPQPWLRQQPGVIDMQLRQQNLIMYKQLQELQRQQQLQQLDQETRQENSLSQMSGMAKQGSGDQLPSLVNGSPFLDTSNYIWQGQPMGVDSRIRSTSQMVMLGNWGHCDRSPAMQGFPNGPILPQDQSQVLRSMGFVPQQLDQSLYGAPVATTRGSMNQYSHFQGIVNDDSDMLTKAGGNPVDRTIKQSSAFNAFQSDHSTDFSNQAGMADGFSISRQGFQRKNFEQGPVQTLHNGVLSQNSQQVNPFSRNVQVQEFPDRQERTCWEENWQEKTAVQVGSSQGFVSLDPTEAKILFSTDEGIWDSSFGRIGCLNAGGYASGIQLEGTDYSNAFPSVQSGSWSALMQSAVAETSSSDTGLQDEWNGLSFQKAESSTGNCATLIDNGKQPTTWVDNDLHALSPLTSRPFPQFDNSNMSHGAHGVQGFHHSSSHESHQLAPKETNNWYDQSPQKSLTEGSFQVQTPMHLDNNQEGACGSQIYEQSHGKAQSLDMELNSQYMQGSWLHQKGSPSYRSQSCNKPNGWNINQLLAINEDATTKTPDNETIVQHDHKNSKSTGGFDRVKSGASSPQVPTDPHMTDLKINQEMNQLIQQNHQLNYVKHAMLDASLYGSNKNAGKRHQPMQVPDVLESSVNISEKHFGEAYDKKHGNHYQNEITDSYVPGHSHPGNTVGDGMKENAWSGASATHPLVSGNQKSDNQGQSQSGTLGSRSQERGFYGQSRLVAHAVLNSGLDIRKGNLPDLQRTAGVDELASRSSHSGYESPLSASFDRSTPIHSPNNRTIQTSQNMLELLHKLDQSRESNSITNVGPSDHNPSEMPEATEPNSSVAHVQHNQSSGLQSFGLRLAPPSQRPLTSNHVPSQAYSKLADDLIPKHIDQEINSGTITSGIPFSRNQLQQQHTSNASGQIAPDQPLNLSFTSQTNLDAQSKLTSHFRQQQTSYYGSEQSPQTSLPGSAGRILPFNLAPPADAHGPVLSAHSYSISAGHSQSTNANSSYISGSGQLVSAPKLTATSGMAHGGFSSMLHNVWTNLSSQHVSVGPASKVPSKLLQSVHPANGPEGASWSQQKADDKGMNRGKNGLSKLDTCSINSRQFMYGEEQLSEDRSLQQLTPEEIGLAADKAAASASLQEHEPPLQPRQQYFGRGKPGLVTSFISQKELVSFQNPDNSIHESGSSGHSLKPSDEPHDKSSLLHHMQAIEGIDANSSWKSVKRLKGANFGADAHQAVAKTGQQFPYGHSMGIELSTSPHHSQFPTSDAKMLCFSTEAKEDLALNVSYHGRIGDSHSEDRMMFGQNDLECHSGYLGRTSTSSLGGIERSQIKPKMAPSWFERDVNHQNEQILSMHDGFDSSCRDSKVDAQQFLYRKESEGLNLLMSKDQANAGYASQTGSVWRSPAAPIPTTENLSLPQSLPSAAVDQSLVDLRPKKRKSEMWGPIPWHEEVNQGFHTLQSISMSELDWAQATNRFIEKMEDEAEMTEDGPIVPRPRRRLILTTQLMQQLFRSLPSPILSADGSSEVECVTYFTAKLALGDACSLLSCSGSDCHIKTNSRSMLSGKAKPSERAGDQFLSKVVDDFITRGKKLESDLLRLDKKASILDIRVECQDLERFSVINHFAKFHGRSNADGMESSSSSEATVLKSYPQRYVTALPVPRNLPDGVSCLSL